MRGWYNAFLVLMALLLGSPIWACMLAWALVCWVHRAALADPEREERE